MNDDLLEQEIIDFKKENSEFWEKNMDTRRELVLKQFEESLRNEIITDPELDLNLLKIVNLKQFRKFSTIIFCSNLKYYRENKTLLFTLFSEGIKEGKEEIVGSDFTEDKKLRRFDFIGKISEYNDSKPTKENAISNALGKFCSQVYADFEYKNNENSIISRWKFTMEELPND